MGKQGVRLNLDNQDVVDIYQAKADGYKNIDIAKKYGISDSTVSMILHGEACKWARVPQDLINRARSRLIYRGKKAKKAQQVNHPELSASDAFIAFSRACFALRDAEKDCLDAGIDPDFLSETLMGITKQNHL